MSGSTKSRKPQKGSESAKGALAPPNTIVNGNAVVLDTTSGGGPFIPGGIEGAGPMGMSGSTSSPVLPEDEVVVEVELAPTAANIGSALTANTAGFLASNETASAPSGTDSGFGAVLRQFNLQDARQVFYSRASPKR